MTGGVWELWLGPDRIARFEADDYEFPWTHARLVESVDFDRFRVYFSDDALWPDSAEFDALIDEIHTRGRFTLRDASSGAVYMTFTLNQDRDRVWFRYAD